MVHFPLGIETSVRRALMGMKRWFAIVLVVFLAASASLAADLAADANYKAKCAVCHGASAEGKPAIKTGPLKDAANKSEAELVTRIENGSTGTTAGTVKMPAFKDKLTPDQIKVLVAEIKALK
jgi:mono/diheme cytochrome c family protein